MICKEIKKSNEEEEPHIENIDSIYSIYRDDDYFLDCMERNADIRVELRESFY